MNFLSSLLVTSVFLTAGIAHKTGNESIVDVIDSLISNIEPGNTTNLITNGGTALSVIERNRDSIIFTGQTLYNFEKAMNIHQRDSALSLVKLVDSKPNVYEKLIGYYILTKSFFRLGDIDNAGKYYRELKLHPQSYIHELISYNYVKSLHDAEKGMKQIQRMNIPDDEHLWLVGTLLFDKLQVEENETESYYILDYPISLLDSICTKYPKSKWADNAKFKLLLYYEGFTHEHGEYDTTCITEYKLFISKYPSSEFRTKAMAKIAEHLLWFIEEQTREMNYDSSQVSFLLYRVENIYKTLLQYNIDDEFRDEIANALNNVHRLHNDVKK